MKTVGVVNRIEDRKVIEIAEPFGVVAAIVPSTNPTSTAIYKILIALKARCAIVISPHPSAARCITRVAEIMAEAARAAGAARRRHRLDDDGHARGHAGADEAARGGRDPRDRRHGPGARRVQRRQAGLRRRARQRAVLHRVVGRPREGGVATSSSARRFDNGVLCSSPNSVVVDEAVAEEVRRQFQAQGALLPDRRPRCDALGEGAGHAAAAAESGAGRQAGDAHRREGRHHACRRARARSSRRSTGVGRDYPAVDREAVPGPLVLRREGLARGLRALQADPAVRRHGPHHVDPLAERRR